jgi:peptide chain release factor 1
MLDIAKFKKQYPIEIPLQKKKELEEVLATAHTTTKEIDMSKVSADLNYYTTVSAHLEKLHKHLTQYSDAQELIQTESDKEMVEMAKMEAQELEKTIPTLSEEITAVQIEHKFKDPNDMKSVIMEIRAGAGGDEASLFAADVYQMYSIFAKNKNWNVSIIASSVTEQGGYKEVIAKIEGKNAYKLLKYESGVHRVQRIPVTESGGRIHTSTASVAVLPEATDVNIEIAEADLKVEAMKASGAGGQHVNKTSSAIRMTHIPTGIAVYCQESRVQQQNRATALEILKARLYEQKREEEANKRSDMRNTQIGTGMRAEKIRTYNFPQNRITDHRIKISWHNLDKALEGDIANILDTVGTEMLKLMLLNSD